MSYQYKKSSILYQLEQAIKKKVAEKPKSREQAAQRGMQPSLQKRKTQNLRQSVQRLPSKTKQSIKLTKADNMTIFNNQNLSNLHSNVMESKLAQHKKFNNRKLDKLFSLVNYAISSADKAMKYINYANFQGQFAVKLFKSDKENLFNQMKNITSEDLLDQSSNREQNMNSKINNVPSVIILQEENMKLKKQLAILQKQNERSRFGGQQGDLNITLLLRQLEIQKYKQSIYRIKGKQFIEKLENIIEKQLKYESIATKGHHSPSKQFDSIVKSLISERNNLCKDTQYLSLDRREWEDIKCFIDTKMAALANKKDGSYLKILQKYVATVQLQLAQKSTTKKPHSEEHILAEQQKISKIKEEKQELMRQIQLCKKKLGEMIEITKLKTEIEMHKKQMNKIHSKLLKSNVVEEQDQQLSTDELINRLISKLKNREQDNKKQIQLADRLQQYQIQLQEYKNQNQILEKQVDEKISQINKLGLEKVKLVDRLNGKTKQYEKIQKQMDSIKRDIAKKEDTIKQLQKQNNYLISKIQQVQNQQKQQQQQQQQHQQIEKLNLKIQQQQQLLLQYHQDKEKLIQELSSINAQLQSRKQQHIKKEQHYKQQIQVMQSNLTKLSSDNQQIKQDSQFTINSLEKDIHAISDKFEQVKENYEKTISNLKKEMISSNEQHQKNIQEMQAQHEKQSQQLQQIVKQYKTRAEELKQTINNSQNKTKQIKQKIEEVKRKLAQSEQKNKQLQHSLQQQEHNTDKLAGQIEQKNKVIGELQNNINQKTIYQTGMRQQIEGYRKRIIDMNTKMQQLQEKNKNHISHQSLLKQTQVQKQQRERVLQQTCQSYRIQNNDLKLELEQKMIQLTQMYTKMNDNTSQMNRLSGLQQELSNKQQQISARQLQIQQKLGLINSKEQNVISKSKQIEQKQIQLNQKQKQIEAIKLQQQQTSINIENIALERQRVNEKEKELEDREQKLKQKQEQMEQKESRLDDQLKQIQINRNKLTSLQHQLDNRIKEVQQKEDLYTNKIKELNDKYNQINEQRANLQSLRNELNEKQSVNINKQQDQEEEKQLIRTMLEQKQSEIIQQYEQKLVYIKQQTEQQLTNMKQLLQKTIHQQQVKIEHQNKLVEQLQKFIAEKQVQLKEKEIKIAQYQQSQEQINAKVQLLSNELANMQQIKDKQMEQQCKEYKTKQNILQERIQVLDKQLNIKSHALHEISELQASLESQVQQKSVLIERLEMKISMKQKQIQNAHNRGQTLEQQNKKLLEQLCKIGQQISQLKQSQVEQPAEVEDLDKKNEEENNKQQLISLFKNVEHMQERIQQFQTRQKQLSQLHESYKNSIKQMKEELEQKNYILKEKQQQYQDILLKYQFNNINADQLEQQRMKNSEEITQMNKKMEELSKNNKNLEQWKSVQLMYEKQYFNLSKRILSALFDLSQLGNVDEMGLRTLLEIGSQKAIEQKKRLRDQQSNEKRRRDSQYQLEDQQKQNYYLKKQEYGKKFNPSVELFSTHSQLPGMGSQLANDSIKLQKKQEDQEKEKEIQNLEQFDNFQSGINSSMISEDGLIQNPFIKDQQRRQIQQKNQNDSSKNIINQEQKNQSQNKENNQMGSQEKDSQNIEDFNDYQSEKMNQSMLSHNQEQKLNPFSQSKEQQNEVSSGIDHQSSPQINKTQDINIPVSVDSNKNKEEIKDGDGSRSAFQFDQFKENNYSELDSSLISEKHGDQAQQVNKHVEQKGNQQIKLQQKVPVNEVEKIKQQEHAGQDKFNIDMDISQIVRTQPNNQGNNSMEFENFLDFQNSNMDSSMISQKLEKDDKESINQFNLQNNKALDKSQQKQVQENKNKENDFGDFNDYESNKLSESMISQNDIKIEKIQFQVKESLNQNKQKEVSLQKQQNDLDDFADFKSEKLDSSMMSNTDINLPQNQKQPVFPANGEPKQSNSANFDEFGEFNSQMNSSMMSDYENSSNK